MYRKFSQLSFVIGVFFTIVSLILFVNALLGGTLTGINLYTALTFLLFGLGMIFLKSKGAEEEQ